MKYTNFCNKFYKILVSVMLLLWGIITCSTIFSIYNNESYHLSTVIVLLGVVIILLLLVVIYRFYQSMMSGP